MGRNGIIRKLTERSGLHGEPINNDSLLELSGDDRILIENHHCVISYCHDEIAVRVKFGIVHIKGHSLVLACASKEQLVIHGKIDCVILERV